MFFLVSCKTSERINNEIQKDTNGDIQYAIRGKRAYRIIENKEYEINDVIIGDCFIGNYRHYFFILDEYNESRLKNEKPGTYLLNYKNELVDIIPYGSTEESLGLFFSPNSDYFGIDGGTWTVRGMNFYSYPEYKEIGSISYKGKIFWKDNTVIYTTVGNDIKPESPMDDGYYHYIEEFNLETGKKKILYYFSELTDIQLYDFIYDTLIVIINYVDKIEDWKEYEKYKQIIKLIKYEDI
jgi:hypothetical protein